MLRQACLTHSTAALLDLARRRLEDRGSFSTDTQVVLSASDLVEIQDP